MKTISWWKQEQKNQQSHYIWSEAKCSQWNIRQNNNKNNNIVLT